MARLEQRVLQIPVQAQNPVSSFSPIRRVKADNYDEIIPGALDYAPWAVIFGVGAYIAPSVYRLLFAS